MATIERSVKRGDVRKFDESYSKGFKTAYASEVDADFDILYDAWNFGTTNVSAGGVTTDKLADGAVTSAKLGQNSVNSGHIIDGSVNVADLNAGVASRLPPTYGVPDVSKILAVNPGGTALTWVSAPPASLVTGQVTTQFLADAPNGVTDGKITSVAWGKVTGAPAAMPPTGAAGGDLTGTYPNPTVVPAGAWVGTAGGQVTLTATPVQLAIVATPGEQVGRWSLIIAQATIRFTYSSGAPSLTPVLEIRQGGVVAQSRTLISSGSGLAFIYDVPVTLVRLVQPTTVSDWSLWASATVSGPGSSAIMFSQVYVMQLR